MFDNSVCDFNSLLHAADKIPVNGSLGYWVTRIFGVTISLFWKNKPEQMLATTSNGVEVLLAGNWLIAVGWRKWCAWVK